MTSSRTSSIMAEKKFKIPNLFRFLAFYVNNLTLCGDNLKSFPRILFKLLCMLLISSSWTSSIMAEKKFKMADLLRFFAFYVNNLSLWAR